MTTTITAPAGQVPTGVACGNRKVHGGQPGRHATTAEVRACFNAPAFTVGPDERVTLRFLDDRSGVAVRTEVGTQGALVEIGEPVQVVRYHHGDATDHPSSYVSARAALIPVSDTDGHAGYATLASDGKTVELWEVERPVEGKHAGVTFVRPIGKSWRENLKGAERARVFLAIARDLQAAAELYFDNTQKCSQCRHKIWAKESLARKMGPKCAEKVARSKAALART